jgi:uncharacterized protein YggT (Ycf19 family)
MPVLLANYPLMFVFMLPAIIFFLRFLVQYSGCNYYHRFSQFLFIVTKPFNKLFNNMTAGDISVASLLNMLLSAELGLCVFFYLSGWIGSLIQLFILNLVFLAWGIVEVLIILLIVTAVLSWIPKLIGINYYLLTMLKPLIAPFDRFIPRIGVISLSFLAVFLLMTFVDQYAMPAVFRFFSKIQF